MIIEEMVISERGNIGLIVGTEERKILKIVNREGKVVRREEFGEERAIPFATQYLQVYERYCDIEFEKGIELLLNQADDENKE